MKEALQSAEAYERYIYSLQDRYNEITLSTLVIIHRGPHRCQLQGEIHFARNIVLRVYERLDFIDNTITYHSYEVRQNESLEYWHDPQPHPTDPTLALNHPHHKHVPPDIKHHRVPAPELAFDRPNLPFLFHEIIATLLTKGEME